MRERFRPFVQDEYPDGRAVANIGTPRALPAAAGELLRRREPVVREDVGHVDDLSLQGAPTLRPGGRRAPGASKIRQRLPLRRRPAYASHVMSPSVSRNIARRAARRRIAPRSDDRVEDGLELAATC